MNETPIQTWARGVANRIKLIQTSWADDKPSLRQETIRKEIRKSLDSLPKDERKTRLDALKVHFPTWGESEVQVVEVTKELPPRRHTPDELLDQLVAAYPQLSERQRRQYSERLMAAGFQVQPPPPVAETPAAGTGFQLQKKTEILLGLAESPTVYPTQVFLVLHELLENMVELQRDATGVRRELEKFIPKSASSPRQRARPTAFAKDPSDAIVVLRGYLSGDPTVSDDHVRTAVGQLGSELRRFVWSPSFVRDEMREELAKVLGPKKIENLVEVGTFGSKKAGCWDKFVDLWDFYGYDKLGDETKYWGRTYAEAVLEALSAPEAKPRR